MLSISWCKYSLVIDCNPFLITAKSSFLFSNFWSFVNQSNSTHKFSMGCRRTHPYLSIFLLMCLRADDNHGKQFFSPFEFSLKRWFMVFAENFTPVWASNLSGSWCLVGVPDLEVLIINQLLWLVVSIQNQDHNCNLHSIYLNPKFFFFKLYMW